jgi:hypothetical protein
MVDMDHYHGLTLHQILKYILSRLDLISFKHPTN